MIQAQLPVPADRLEYLVGQTWPPRINRSCTMALEWCVEGTLRLLESAWPQVKGWLEREDIYDFKITLCCINPDFAFKNKDWLGKEVSVEAKRAINTIVRYINENKKQLNDKRITINLADYQAFPGIHGIMVGNGYLFISLSRWGPLHSNRFGGQFYESFNFSDNTPRAQAYRRMFKELIQMAEESSRYNKPYEG